MCVICPPQHFCDTMWDRIARAPSVSSFLVFSDSAHLLAIGKDDCTHEECGTIRPWPQSLTKARPVESTVHVQGKEYAIDTVCGDGGREALFEVQKAVRQRITVRILRGLNNLLYCPMFTLYPL